MLYGSATDGSALLSHGGVTRLVTRIKAEGLLRRAPVEDDEAGCIALWQDKLELALPFVGRQSRSLAQVSR